MYCCKLYNRESRCVGVGVGVGVVWVGGCVKGSGDVMAT